jgi:hypothetical protein
MPETVRTHHLSRCCALRWRTGAAPRDDRSPATRPAADSSSLALRHPHHRCRDSAPGRGQGPAMIADRACRGQDSMTTAGHTDGRPGRTGARRSRRALPSRRPDIRTRGVRVLCPGGLLPEPRSGSARRLADCAAGADPPSAQDLRPRIPLTARLGGLIHDPTRRRRQASACAPTGLIAAAIIDCIAHAALIKLPDAADCRCCARWPPRRPVLRCVVNRVALVASS